MLGKRKIRKNAFELLFGYQFNKEENAVAYYNTSYHNFICEDDEEESVKSLFLGISDNIEAIDEKISQYLNGWKLERLSKATLTILRISTYEMIFLSLAPAISINEAVEFAKQYAEDGAQSFINGVLNNLSKGINDNA
jgi:N utilization substance protein B